MDKKYLHHFWVRLRPIKPVYFFVLCVIFALIATFALRDNNLRMVTLREAVWQADKNNTDVEASIKLLREHVYSHMNTDLSTGISTVYPPLQLRHSYERAVAAEKDRVQKANAQIYTDAQNHCEKLFPGSFSGGPRVPCIAEYVTTHGVKVNTIPDATYKFDFVSPTWSPDLAGWTLLTSVGFFLLFVVRLVLGLWLSRATK